MKSVILIYICITIIRSQKDDDDLQVNILPSDKYRLNKRDLTNLKSDIERQVMKIIF